MTTDAALSATETAALDQDGHAAQGESQAGSDAQAETEATFTRKYVQELRDESAKYRTRSKSLVGRLVTAYAAQTGRLHDPTDLPATDDLAGDDGLPDPDKVTAAVEELIKTKPHLARIRPVGNVGQGSTTDASEDGAGAFANLLRGVVS